MKHAIVIVSLALLPRFAEAGCGSLADISVYDRRASRELPIHFHNGRCYVAGTPRDEYRIAVRNRAGEDLLAVVSVDGVNVITGETASASQSGYVIGASDALDIKGWRKSLERVAAFYFTDLGDSYAHRTGRRENVEVIGAALFCRKASPPPAPLAEGMRKDRSDASADGAAKSAAPEAESRLGTGHGQSLASSARYTSFERATDAPAEVVTIFYDSRANLLASGVIPRPPARRDPSPFPVQFVPDPPQRTW